MVLMRNRVWLARGGRGIAGEEHQVLKAVQDEASPAALRSRTQKRRGFCLQSAKAFFGEISQKLTTRAASTLAMTVQRL
jgi:hypothetical protein